MDVENKQAVEQEVHTENALAEGIDLHSLEEEVYLLTGEFIEKAKLKKGQLFVVGCSLRRFWAKKSERHRVIPLQEPYFGEFIELQRSRISFSAPSAVNI